MKIRLSSVTPIERPRSTRRAVGLCSRWAGLGVLLLILLPIPVASESGSTVLQAPVRGEMILLTVDLVVVKSVEGTSILIPLGKDAKIDPSLKVGDRVEVGVTSDKQASSVTKLTPDPLQQ